LRPVAVGLAESLQERQMLYLECIEGIENYVRVQETYLNLIE
jgi:hypothetical protein